MKNFWSVIILLAVILGLGFYYSSHSDQTPVPAENTATTTTTNSNITATTTHAHIVDKNARISADIDTPVISGHANAEAFNSLAKVYVDRATEDFTRNAAEANFNIPDVFKGMSHNFIAAAHVNTFGGRYATVLFDREYDMLAAAHPAHIQESLNYDLDQKKVIELSDMFADVNKALHYISAQATAQVKGHLNDVGAGDSFLAEGVSPKEANYTIFIISQTGITFYFGEYQAAPYAAGPQQAVLSWQELRPLLTPDFKALAQ